jgi:hypothetical protein
LKYEILSVSYKSWRRYGAFIVPKSRVQQIQHVQIYLKFQDATNTYTMSATWTVTLAVSCRPVKPGSLSFSSRLISNPQLAIHELTNGMIAAAPKCGNANPIPACFIVTNPSTTPSTANIVAISETALTSPRCRKIAAMIPKVRLRPPTH